MNPIFLSVKAELNCKITGMISFENDIDMNVKIHSFYVDVLTIAGRENCNYLVKSCELMRCVWRKNSGNLA